MKCPSCSKKAPADAAECPSCGIVFAKWKKRREREEELDREEKARAIAALEAGVPERAPVDPRLGRGIAAFIILVWMVGFGLYYRRLYLAHHKPPKGVPTGEFAEVRDPKTGDVRRLPIRRYEPGPPTQR